MLWHLLLYPTWGGNTGTRRRRGDGERRVPDHVDFYLARPLADLFPNARFGCISFRLDPRDAFAPDEALGSFPDLLLRRVISLGRHLIVWLLWVISQLLPVF